MTNKGKHYNVGEAHGRAKLTSVDVETIRREYRRRDSRRGALALARRFGVTWSHVCRIVRGEAWAVQHE